MWIGVDDTDSSEGMCTTYLAPQILLKLNLDLIGFPRLVRLNPNIPWKTRGNAAIALRVGKGIGEKRKVGEFKGEEIYSYQRGKEVDYDNILDNVKEIVEKFAIFDDKKTSPGIVITKKKLTEKIYWKAVRSVINLDEIYNYIENTQFFGYKSKRGLIGASAAISLKPKKKTYELITYLPREKWLDERFVDKFSVIEMDKKITSTFENYDYKNDHVAIKPETKTPVLFGIRGIDPWDLFKALSIVKSDPYDGYIIFETNQGTDDHLVKKRISQIKPYDSVIVNGIINSKPRIIKGGHVIFSIKDPTGEIECAAYEKTKEFREVIKNLIQGDKITVYGSIKKYPRTINVEKIKIRNLVDVYVKEIPKCPICGKSMESVGKNKGYRCKKCGTYVKEPIYKKLERSLNFGIYQVPIVARRHLSKPIEFFQE